MKIEQIMGVLALVAGEGLSIYAEMRAAQDKSDAWICWATHLPFITLGGFLLVGGYILCYRSFSNIWLVTALSVGSILILEPVICWTVLGEMPERGAFIGLVLGALGMIAALVL